MNTATLSRLSSLTGFGFGGAVIPVQPVSVDSAIPFVKSVKK